MDSTEEIAEKYLRSQGYESVVYEPDGNIPPDFLVDRRIAVEVRRLNQHDQSERPRGLEETQIPLLQRMRKLLTTLGPPTTDQSWFVTYDFERPLEKWPILKQQIEAALTNSLLQPSVKRHYLVVNDRFRLAVMPASTVSSQKFVVGGYSDDDSGGWTLHELQRNAQLCVDEKTKKVAAYQNRYSEWWLLLANYISYSISGLELELFDPRLAIPAPWSRVIFVNPLKPTLGLEFHPRGRPSNR